MEKRVEKKQDTMVQDLRHTARKLENELKSTKERLTETEASLQHKLNYYKSRCESINQKYADDLTFKATLR